jgi:outer membrane protein assembly factor BamB
MGKIARLAAVAASVLALTGCWPVPGQNANRTAYNDLERAISPATVVDLEEAWATRSWGLPVLAPVTSPDGVHIAPGGCGLVTLDAATGATRWSRGFFPGGPEICALAASRVRYGSPPFVAGDQVLAGNFWWQETPTRPEFGTQTMGLSTASGAAGADGYGSIIAGVRGDTGLFVYPSLFPRAAPFGYETFFPEVAIVSLDGSSPSRNFRIGTALRGQSWDGSVPTLGQDLLFHAGVGLFATEPGDPTDGPGLRAFSVTESRPDCGPIQGAAYPIYVECPVWTTPIDGLPDGPPVVAPDQSTVYTGTRNGTVYAVNAHTGAVRWTASVGAAVADSPALAGDTLFVPTEDGRLVALRASGCGRATCTAKWVTQPAGGALSVQPAVAGGVVFTGAADGTVSAYDAGGCGRAASCSPLWSSSTGSEITGAPAVSSGQVYVGTADSRLVAYRLPRSRR